jgi:hypothetical protein
MTSKRGQTFLLHFFLTEMKRIPEEKAGAPQSAERREM